MHPPHHHVSPCHGSKHTVTCGRCALVGRRGNRLGTRLTAQLLDIAYREFGYKRAVLDTLERLPAAIRLYNSLGFDRIEAYCYNPLHDVVYMGCALPWTAPSTQEAAEGASKAADA